MITSDMRTELLVVSILFLAACAAPEAPATPINVAASTAHAVAPSTPSGPFAGLPPSLPLPQPGGEAKPVARSGKTWPFHDWDRAEVFLFNWTPYGPQTSERIYDEKRWSPNVKYRAALDREQAELARHLVEEAGGEILQTKCPNPHHAVIFYDGETPVGSVSVSFECPDVLLWPRWPSTPNAGFDSTDRWSHFFFRSDRVRLPETPPDLLQH